MELYYRSITEKEIEYALECHCRICHASNNFRGERPSYDAFRNTFKERGVWEESRLHIRKSMEDDRTILSIIEAEQRERVGYCWVVFSDWYEQHKADINGIYVEELYRRQGVGHTILAYIEREARARGANLLVSDTGVDNLISQAMHKKYGFEPRWFEYQIWL